MVDFVDAIELLRMIEKHGFAARVVGGAVRDFLLKRENCDVDIATVARPEHIENIAKKENLRYIEFGKKYGACRLLFRQKAYEITTLRREENGYDNIQFIDSFEEDSQRRDFTINALYMDSSEKIYDYHDGIKDLENHEVKFIGDPPTRIAQDPVRLLRYIRFALTYGQVDENLVVRHVDALKNANPIKAISELTKILSLGNVNTIIPALNMVFVTLFGVNVTEINQKMSGKEMLYSMLSTSNQAKRLSEKFGLSFRKLKKEKCYSKVN